MKSTRFLYLALMMKYTSKTMDVMDWLPDLIAFLLLLLIYFKLTKK